VGTKRDERGSVLVEFALVSVVFVAMIVGGLFVFLGVIAKTQATAQTASAADFAAAGGCPETPTVGGTTSTTSCHDGVTPSPSCVTTPLQEQNTSTTVYMTDPATLATICEIEQVLGSALIDTESGSLQVAIYCSYPSSTTTTSPDESGQSCANAPAVWVCARAWDTNAYPAIISPEWIGAESEQIVATTVPAATTTTATTVAGSPTTTAGPTTTTVPVLQFETFYPANPTGQDYSSTPALSCGPS